MNKELLFEELNDDTRLESSAGCHTNGASGCCTTYCTDHGPTCKVQDENVWGKFLEENGGIIQY